MVSMTRQRLKGNHRQRQRQRERWATVGLAVFGVSFVLYALSGDSTSGVSLRNTPNTHPDLKLALAPEEAESPDEYNAIALDIIRTLDCHSLLNATETSRRLQEARQLQEEGSGEGEMTYDEPMDDGLNDYSPPMPTANGQHLFCVAAFAQDDQEIAVWKSRLQCDASHTKQKLLLDVWSEARASMTKKDLLHVLKLARESEKTLVGQQVHLWAPLGDDGLEYLLEHNYKDETDVDHGGVYGLSLGPDQLFVDVGSCLGLAGLAISLLYPGTHVVSIEAVAPNWLLGNINHACVNTPRHIQTSLLAGVGPSHHNHMAEFVWQPSATTAARSWTPKKDRQVDDLTVTVQLRPFANILQQAGISQDRIDVLNIDCEGCEYNLVPALSANEFESLHTVMGNLHWGYIPVGKKPSSARGKQTHERLCHHENFARLCKECCAFLDLPIRSSLPGEVLVNDAERFPPQASTVQDVAGDLCDDFDSWVVEHDLYTVDSDFGWFDVTDMASD